MPRPASRVRTPQQARSRRTRQRILEAAVHCFASAGFEGATTAAIAERARIAVGTLYAYFHDKRDILLELADDLLERVSQQVEAGLERALEPGADLRESLRRLIDQLFHLEIFEPETHRILWARYFTDPDFHERMVASREHTRGVVEAVIRELGVRGALRPLDPVAASRVIVNAVQWNANLAFMEGGPEQRDAAAAAVADLIDHYLFPDPS